MDFVKGNWRLEADRQVSAQLVPKPAKDNPPIHLSDSPEYVVGQRVTWSGGITGKYYFEGTVRSIRWDDGEAEWSYEVQRDGEQRTCRYYGRWLLPVMSDVNSQETLSFEE